MKYENFKLVKELVKDIDEKESLKSHLSTGNVRIKLHDGSYSLLEVNPTVLSGDRFESVGVIFLNTLMQILTSDIDRMRSELSTL